MTDFDAEDIERISAEKLAHLLRVEQAAWDFVAKEQTMRDQDKLTTKQKVLVQQLDKVLQLLEERDPDGFILCKPAFDGKWYYFAFMHTKEDADKVAEEIRGCRVRPFMFLDEK